MENKEFKKIYLTQEEKEKFIKELKKLENELEDFTRTNDHKDSTYFNRLNSLKNKVIQKRNIPFHISGDDIQKRNNLSHIVVIELDNSNETVNFNDIVKLSLSVDKREAVEMNVRLVGDINQEKIDGVTNISVHSPIGNAIYKKSINTKFSGRTDADKVFNGEILDIQRENEIKNIKNM